MCKAEKEKKGRRKEKQRRPANTFTDLYPHLPTSRVNQEVRERGEGGGRKEKERRKRKLAQSRISTLSSRPLFPRVRRWGEKGETSARRKKRGGK